MKKLLIFVAIISLISCAPAVNSASQDTPPAVTVTTSPTITATVTLPPKPTNTPIPEFNPEIIAFPYDMEQILQIRNGIRGADPFITYQIVNRNDFNDPCTRHPGDLLIPLATNSGTPKSFKLPVKMLYKGKQIRKWTTQGGDIGITFYVGFRDGKHYYLDVYHSNTLENIGFDWIDSGTIWSYLTGGSVHGNHWSSQNHFTLLTSNTYNPNIDFMNDSAEDISPYLLPITLFEANKAGDVTAITYEGENFCNMNSSQKIEAIHEELKNAGFCKDGNTITYCGSNANYQGIQFNQSLYGDGRTVLLSPK